MFFLVSLDAGSVLERQNKAKRSNLEPKGHQKDTKSGQNRDQSVQNGTKMEANVSKVNQNVIKQIKNKVQKNSDPGHPEPLGGLGPDHLLRSFREKVHFAGKFDAQHSSEINPKIGTQNEHRKYQTI